MPDDSALIEGWGSMRVVPGLNWLQVISASRPVEDTWTVGSDSLTSEIDRKFLIACRKASDLVVTSYRTAVAENYRASAIVPIAVVSRHSTFKHENQADDKKALISAASLDAATASFPQAKRLLLESGLSFARSQRSQIRQILVGVTNAHSAPHAHAAALKLAALIAPGFLITHQIELDGTFFFAMSAAH